MGTEYRRGYAKGYNTGRGERSAEEQRHQAEMLLVAQRAERAETAVGIGHCEECRHWDRPKPIYAWGSCTVGRQPGSPYGCWAQVQEGKTHQPLEVSTSPQFGCVLFAARANTLPALEGPKP